VTRVIYHNVPTPYFDRQFQEHLVLGIGECGTPEEKDLMEMGNCTQKVEEIRNIGEREPHDMAMLREHLLILEHEWDRKVNLK